MTNPCGDITALAYRIGWDHPDDVRMRIERLSERDPLSGCWVWTGDHSGDGYPRITMSGRRRQAHRISYEAHVGSIPDGMEIDHLCRRTLCVNPAHLEPVTGLVNRLRAPDCPVGVNAIKTHCDNGHLFDESNTAIVGGWRKCRACARDRMRAYRARKRVGAEAA